MNEYKTPLRVSLFGGGTDYPAWYKDHGGMTIGGAINFFVRWQMGISENQCTHDEVEIIQKLKSFLGYSDTYFYYENNAHLFIGKGLGASSASFSSLIKLLTKDQFSDEEIIQKVTNFERNYLGKDSGDQDQILVNTPGFRWVEFLIDLWKSDVFPLTDDFRQELNDSLFLIDTNVARNFPNITSQSIRHDSGEASIKNISDITKEAFKVLSSDNASIEAIGKLLDETWKAKKGINPHISNESVDQIITMLKKENIFGAKLLGSGGGGFILALAPREIMKKISNKWSIPVMDIEFI